MEISQCKERINLGVFFVVRNGVVFAAYFQLILIDAVNVAIYIWTIRSIINKIVHLEKKGWRRCLKNIDIYSCTLLGLLCAWMCTKLLPSWDNSGHEETHCVQAHQQIGDGQIQYHAERPLSVETPSRQYHNRRSIRENANRSDHSKYGDFKAAVHVGVHRQQMDEFFRNCDGQLAGTVSWGER